MDGLVAKLNYGLDFSDADRVTLISGKSNNVGNNVTGNGLGQLNNNQTLNHLVEATATYNKSFGSVEMEVLGGYSIQSFKNTYNWVIARGFSDFNFDQMESDIRDSFDAADAAASSATSEYNNWGISNDITGGTETSGGFAMSFPDLAPVYFSRPGGVSVNSLAANFYDRTDYLQSYFSRANFTISGKYLITATVRVDGSSTFGDNNKYGVFPSAAFAWQLHEEGFVPDFFNTLKLRVGYGIVGNQDGLGYGNFVRRERAADVGIGDNGSIAVPGTTTQGEANNDLKWEETTQQTIGFDFGFFGERVFGSLDFYKKETSDLLLNVQLAQPALAATRFENLDAIVENKGWELELGFEAIESNDVSLTISGNVSQNKNMVRDFNGNINAGTIYGQGLSGAFAQQLTGGRPLFSYYLREFAGFDGDGQPIRDDQKFVNKSALPEWNAGLSINLAVGDFDFSAYAAGQFGFWIYNNTENAFFTAGAIANGRNVTADVLTSGESGVAEAAVSERFLHKGDFIRMQNVSVGYNVPVDGASVFKNLRFSLNVQNLFLITEYNGIDPEVSTQAANFQLLNNLPTAGVDWAAYPRPRTFTLGLNATF
ncbi:MAG: TonB-dependent receptor [Cyclobacteriaceae bacterium]